MDFLDERQAGNLVINLQKKGVAVGICPIERDVGVSESAVRAQMQSMELAEVVKIELEQIGEDWCVVGCGGNEVNLHGSTFLGSPFDFTHSSKRSLSGAPGINESPQIVGQFDA